MNLKCDECCYIIFDAEDEDEDENSKCLSPDRNGRNQPYCDGRMKYYRTNLPMTGDNICWDGKRHHCGSWQTRVQIVYSIIMEDKRCCEQGLVPKRLRHGLWFHSI